MGDKATPLLDLHKELGARLVDFAGWDMPLQYTGVVAEHNAVREAAGLFDVTHLGKLWVEGPRAVDALQTACTADISALEEGRATYALVLTDAGGCVDDIFVYRMGPEAFLVVPNAANVSAVAAAISESGGDPEDIWDRYAILALQGPNSFDVWDAAFDDQRVRDLALHAWMPFAFDGRQGYVARTGYTGERGVELYVPFESATGVFRSLLDAGAAPVGLGARDTLRLEMAYVLYGHEITLDINPLEARLGWAISWDAPFRGREALAKVKQDGPARRTFGLRCTERGVPRQDYGVLAGENEIGTITSGNFSPTLGTGIALAIGPAELTPSEGDEIAIEARGRAIRGVIVKPPFISKGARS